MSRALTTLDLGASGAKIRRSEFTDTRNCPVASSKVLNRTVLDKARGKR
jgi:hypothetical protein